MPVHFSLVKLWINYARRNKSWLILTFHQVEQTLFSLIKQRAIYGSTTSTLQQTVDYLLQQGIEVVTVRDGIRRVFFDHEIPA